MKRFLFAVALCLGMAHSVLHAEITASFIRRYGVILKSGDRVVSYATYLNVASPGWKNRYVKLDYPAFKAAVDAKGGSYAGENKYFKLAKLDVRCAGDSVTMTFDGEYTGSKGAIYEFMPFSIPAGMFRYGSVRFEAPKGTAGSGSLPLVEDRKLFAGEEFVRIEFRKKGVGTLTVETADGKPFRVLDRRAERYGTNAPPMFIVMQSSHAVKPGDRLTGSFKLTFVPEARPAAEPATVVPARPETGFRTVRAARFPLLPRPKRINYSGESVFNPASAPVAVVRGGDGEGRLLRHAKRIMAPWGIEVRAGKSAPERGIFIAVGKGIEESPEGYTLIVTSDRVVIESATERGAFYGLQTLRGLRQRDGTFRTAAIRDWPDFNFRGLHTKSNSGTFQLYSKVLSKVAAPLKLNAFVLECQYVRWDTLGGAKHPRGMTKEEFVELAKVAHENYIDFVPLQQTFSHNQWLFANGKNRELAEDPEAPLPYNYNASDPRVYQLLEKLFDEVVAAAGAPYLHIGHDEIGDWGKVRFPHRPENVKLGAKELFRRDVMWHVEYAKRKNVKLMLWHDALVSKKEPGVTVAGAIGGTETLRKELPRDLVICVWSYKPREKFGDVDLFLKDGYPVIGCTWEHQKGSDWGNIGCFSRYCLGKPGVLGMLETTWSHFGTETMLNSHFFQVSACVTAAAYFWNTPAGLKKHSAERVLVELLDAPDTQYSERIAAIPFAGNALLDDKPFGFDRLSPVMRTRDGIRFPIMKSGRRTAGLTGRPGETHTIDLGGCKCDRLYLLAAMTEEPITRGLILAKASVVYADGSREEFYLRSPAATAGFMSAPHFRDPDGRTSRVLYELFPPDAAEGYVHRRDTAISWKNGGEIRRLSPVVWVNPRPGKAVRELVLTEFNGTYPWYLLSLAAGSGK